MGLCLVCMCLSKQMGYAMAEGGFRLPGNGHGACVRVFRCGLWGAGMGIGVGVLKWGGLARLRVIVRSFHFSPKCPSFNISNVLRDASVL